MNDLVAALRSLRSQTALSLVVVGTLGLAIGAATSIFSVVDGVMLRPLGYGEEERLVVLWATNGREPADEFPSDSSSVESPPLFRLSPADYRDVRDEVESFAGQAALYRFIGSTLSDLEPAATVGSLAVTTRFFDVLGARPALGRFFTDEDGRPGGERKAVLTHDAWTRRYGADPSVVGSAIDLDGEPHTVLGVAPPGFTYPPGDDFVEVYFQMTLGNAILLDRDHRMFDAVARLADGVELEGAQAELDALAASLASEYAETNAAWKLVARPLRQELLGDLGATLWVLFGAVLLALLVACANIASLLIARSIGLQREFAVRAALGARPRHLLRRSLSESLVLGGLGCGAGVALAVLGTRALSRRLPPEVAQVAEVTVDLRVLTFALLLGCGTTLLFALLPALRSLAPEPLAWLRPADAAGGRGTRRMREAMVVMEVALAIVLLVGMGLMARSFERLITTEPGFNPADLHSVAVKLPRSRYGRSEWARSFEAMVEAVRAVPGVEQASAASDVPLVARGLGLDLEFSAAGLAARLPAVRPNAEVRLVLPQFFATIERRLLAGRDFDASLDSRRRVAMVNRALVERFFGDQEPLGRTLQLQGLGDAEIIGIVDDVHHDSLASKYESEIFLPLGQPVGTAEMQLVVRSNLDPSALGAAIDDALREVDDELALPPVVSLEDRFWASAAQSRFNLALFLALGSSTLLLAAVGSHGIVAFTVAQRTKEIGVRMALGASAHSTAALVLRQAMWLVTAGALLGVFLSLVASRFVERLVFDISALDATTYLAAIGLALLLSILAALPSALRATRIDPVTSLRSET